MSESDSGAAAETTAGGTEERVFLVVVDDSEEMKVALHFACRRAKTSGGRIALLHVQEPAEFQHFLAVGEIMREEKREEAEELMQSLSAEVIEWSGKMPSFYLREGDRSDELVKLLDEEPTISILVLGASVERGGPGPLIDYLLNRGASQLRVPVTIVPGSLSDEAIIAIT